MHLQIYQVGVISYGLGCANPRWPALYTRVTKVCQHFNYGIINNKLANSKDALPCGETYGLQLVHYCTLSLFDIWVTRQSAEWEPPII